ncbi:MAG: polysaccharide pyruvyl transferase family protein, partial [Candidatus Gastranaerophilales bacterium]|nr:polysaccharide pyruvyl transferase family protein [Candidatus Gastranaerophilales bacterium]
HHNYGSVLQALATQMALDKLGYENETIDISGLEKEIKSAKIKYFIKASLTSDILLSKIGMTKTVFIRKFSNNTYALNTRIRSKKFETFIKDSFKLSQVYTSKKELEEKCNSNYNSVLVGSDQLWLPANIAGDYYTLNFVPSDVNTIAYATSFGQEVLPKDIAKKAEVFLRKIKHIGVREEAGQRLIKKLADRDVPIVCDPTLLFSAEDWLTIQKTERIIKDKYIFCYFLGNNPPHRAFAKRLRNATGYKIVALTHLDEYVKSDDKYADETPYDIDPADFLNLIVNAEYVCTDSFHCTVFSILYKKNIFTFPRSKRKTISSTNNRLVSLFNLVGIEEALMNGDEDIEKCLHKDIDFERVNEKIETVREESFLYLQNALSCGNS